MNPIDTELTTVATEINRADTKAAALLSAGGILTAALGLIAANGHTNVIVTALAAALLAGSLVLSALVIRPRLTSTDRASYLHWSTLTANELGAELSEDRRQAKLIALSRLAETKMRLLQRATDVIIAAVLAIVLAAALNAAS